MVWFEIDIGKFKAKYKFPKEDSATENLPYCDSQANILKRINETEQLKQEIQKVNLEKIRLDVKKSKESLSADEEDLLKRSEWILNTYQKVMNMKAYYINETTGEIHQTAQRKVGDETVEKFKGRTKNIPEGEYKETEIYEKDRYTREIRGEMLSPELYEMLKNKKKAVKFLMNFGTGWNEERVYVYPAFDEEMPNVLIMGKVGNTKLKDKIIQDLEELKEYEKLKEMIEATQIQVAKQNRGKIAGSLDD
jgi:hypothetical protein